MRARSNLCMFLTAPFREKGPSSRPDVDLPGSAEQTVPRTGVRSKIYAFQRYLSVPAFVIYLFQRCEEIGAYVNARSLTENIGRPIGFVWEHMY